jgi:integrase
MRLAPNIYPRKDGRFEGRYANGENAHGKTKYGSVYGKTYAETKRKLEEAKAKTTSPKPIIDTPSMTIIAAVGEHISAGEHRLKPSTQAVYRQQLDNHIAPYFGTMLCDSLTDKHAQEFVNKLMRSGLSVNTVQSVFGLLKAAVGLDLLVKFPKISKTKVEFLSPDEQKRVEKSAKASGETDYIAVMLCLYTGLRIGEACGLFWSDICLDSGFLQVERTLQRIRIENGDKKTAVVFLLPKSATSERTIPLPDFLIKLLRNFKKKSATESVLAYNGKHIEPRTLQNRYKKILEAARVRNMSWHSTRHTFSVRMLERGADIKTLSELLGHASPVVTLNVYSHTSVERKRSCINALSAVYSFV